MRSAEALTDREDVAPVEVAVAAVVDQAGRCVVVQEGPRCAGAGQLEEGVGRAGAARVADAGRGAAESAGAAAGRAGLPLDRAVVELDVEGAGRHVGAVDEDDLE